MLLELALELKKALGIGLEFVNIGGGLGIPYHPEHSPLDLPPWPKRIPRSSMPSAVPTVLRPRSDGSGRFITGPHGCLVSTGDQPQGDLPAITSGWTPACRT